MSDRQLRTLTDIRNVTTSGFPATNAAILDFCCRPFWIYASDHFRLTDHPWNSTNTFWNFTSSSYTTENITTSGLPAAQKPPYWNFLVIHFEFVRRTTSVGLAIHEIVDVAFGISLLCCLRTKILLLPVLWPPEGATLEFCTSCNGVLCWLSLVVLGVPENPVAVFGILFLLTILAECNNFRFGGGHIGFFTYLLTCFNTGISTNMSASYEHLSLHLQISCFVWYRSESIFTSVFRPPSWISGKTVCDTKMASPPKKSLTPKTWG